MRTSPRSGLHFPDAIMIDAEKYKKLYLILQDISNAIVISDKIIVAHRLSS